LWSYLFQQFILKFCRHYVRSYSLGGRTIISPTGPTCFRRQALLLSFLFFMAALRACERFAQTYFCDSCTPLCSPLRDLPLPLRSRSSQFFSRPLTAPLPLTQFSARSAPFYAPIPLRSHALTALWFMGFFFFSQPYFDTWCGFSANLECRSEMCCTPLAGNRPTGRKNIAICILRTVAQLCRANFHLAHSSETACSILMKLEP